MGGEFNNTRVKSYLSTNNISYFTTNNTETKANYVERVIRTFRNIMWRYLMSKQSLKYIDVIQDFVDIYNGTPHRSLGNISPSEVKKGNEDNVWDYVYGLQKQRHMTKDKSQSKKSTSDFKYKIGEMVRLSYIKKPFQRDYQQKWTEELFKIIKRMTVDGINLYVLTDFANDPVKGSFYEQELQQVKRKANHTWTVEKVLKRRTNKGKQESLVRWKGWPSKFDSWILSSTIKNIN